MFLNHNSSVTESCVGYSDPTLLLWRGKIQISRHFHCQATDYNPWCLFMEYNSMQFETYILSLCCYSLTQYFVLYRFQARECVLYAFVFFLFDSMSIALLMSIPNGVLSISLTKFRFKCSQDSEPFCWIMSSVM